MFTDLPPHQVIGMPSLSPTMTEGNIAKWRKKEGDKVSAGDVLCEIETDKATLDMESMEEGYVAKILRGDGTKEIKVGEVIAIMVEDEDDIAKFKDYKAPGQGGAKEEAPTQAPSKETTAPLPPPKEDTPSPAPKLDKPAAAPQTEDRIFASPIARKMAEDHKVPISSIKGTGPNGRIVKADIEDYLASGAKAAPPFAPPPPIKALEYEDFPHSQIRKVTASRLLLSKQTIPHYYLTVDTRVDKLMELRSQLNALQEASGGKRISVNDFVIKYEMANSMVRDFSYSSFDCPLLETGRARQRKRNPMKQQQDVEMRWVVPLPKLQLAKYVKVLRFPMGFGYPQGVLAKGALPSVLQIFAPTIEAAKHGLNQKAMAAHMALGIKNAPPPSSWSGRDGENNDKKRRQKKHNCRQGSNCSDRSSVGGLGETTSPSKPFEISLQIVVGWDSNQRHHQREKYHEHERDRERELDKEHRNRDREREEKEDDLRSKVKERGRKTLKKTVAFVLPMLTYISRLPPMMGENEVEGLYVVDMAPTRELEQQIEEKTIKLAHYLDIRVVSGVEHRSIKEQGFKSHQDYEADRMIDMGFEPQVVGVLDCNAFEQLEA
eukprot:Gb_34194 [translate_table: standard]